MTAPITAPLPPAELARIVIDEVTMAGYLTGAGFDPSWSPRPRLHPVTTLGGTLVTDAAPVDHRWHLGVSVALQDVSGTNLWGGRTYLPDRGYSWLDDHRRQIHCRWLDCGRQRIRHDLAWLSHAGHRLLTETRELAWRRVPAHPSCWELDLGFTLTNATSSLARLGSPGIHSRNGAGYGGLFWRLPPSTNITVSTPTAAGENAVRGRPADWLAWFARPATGRPYTLIFVPADEPTRHDPWFVRVTANPGVGSALAIAEPIVLETAEAITRRVRVIVLDGAIPPERVEDLTVAEQDEATSQHPASTPLCPRSAAWTTARAVRQPGSRWEIGRDSTAAEHHSSRCPGQAGGAAGSPCR